METPRTPKQLIDEVVAKTGLSLEQIASRMGLQKKTLQKIKWGDIKLTDANRSQLEKIQASYVGGRAVIPAGVGAPKVFVSYPQSHQSAHQDFSGPRALLQEALNQRGESPAQLAKAIGYSQKVVEGVVKGVGGAGRISEKMARKIADHLGLDVEDLLAGSDSPPVMQEGGMVATVGMAPRVTSRDSQIRNIPIVSMVQAGPNVAFDDEIYQYETAPVADVSDPLAFMVRIHGNSMAPDILEGDLAIVCPSWEPRNGDEVVCRLVRGDTMCKLYQSKNGGKRIILSSYNHSVFPAVEYSANEIEWIYPVQGIQRIRRRRA